MKNGLNKRLGVDLGKFFDKYEDLLVHTALSTNYTLAQVLAIPEQDHWEYPHPSKVLLRQEVDADEAVITDEEDTDDEEETPIDVEDDKTDEDFEDTTVPIYHSYSSSTFVASMYKAAGIFGNLTINAQEFTLKDVYQLDIFQAVLDQRPQVCREADPWVHYCQLMGETRIYLPGVSSVKPYNNMNERCPTSPYHEARTPGC